MEHCYFINHRYFDPIQIPEYSRVYTGNETCEKRLPALSDMKLLLTKIKERNFRVTAVFPFLTEAGLAHAKKMILHLKESINEFEVAASDWGLLNWICENKLAIPVTGRFLAGQQSDPRLNQLPAGEDIKLHLASCTLLKKDVIRFLQQKGINRFEISNPVTGLHLPVNENCRFSVHIPYSPVAIMRWCIGPDMDFNRIHQNCAAEHCNGCFQKWDNPDKNIEFYRIDNAVYFKNDALFDFTKHSFIDRLVIHAGR